VDRVESTVNNAKTGTFLRFRCKPDEALNDYTLAKAVNDVWHCTVVQETGEINHNTMSSGELITWLKKFDFFKIADVEVDTSMVKE
jgi:hypothetical protein